MADHTLRSVDKRAKKIIELLESANPASPEGQAAHEALMIRAEIHAVIAVRLAI